MTIEFARVREAVDARANGLQSVDRSATCESDPTGKCASDCGKPEGKCAASCSKSCKQSK